MADVYVVVLRAFHIPTAVFWAGVTFVMAGFHEVVLDAGDAERTLRRLADYAGVSQVIGIAGVISVLTGLLMYWTVSGGLNPGWVRSPYGATITVGAVAGLLAFVVGAGFAGLTNTKVEAMAADGSHGGGLTNEQSAVLKMYRHRISLGERLVAVLLLVAVIAMATAQYV